MNSQHESPDCQLQINPVNTPLNRSPYPVTIDFANNGWIVVVGCKRFVFQQKQLQDFLIKLREYLESPKEVIDKYIKKELQE